jgi:hypothetical protein
VKEIMMQIDGDKWITDSRGILYCALSLRGSDHWDFGALDMWSIKRSITLVEMAIGFLKVVDMDAID